MIIVEHLLEIVTEAIEKFPELHLKVNETFLIVDDPYVWATNNNIAGIEPGDIAFSVKSRGIIVLKKQISKSKMKEILSGIDFRVIFLDHTSPSMFSSSKRLDTDEKFLMHTIFHEIGHLKEGHIENKEALADVFAFDQMGIKTKMNSFLFA